MTKKLVLNLFQPILLYLTVYLDLEDEERRLDRGWERLDLDLEEELLLDDRDRFFRPFFRLLSRPLLDVDDRELPNKIV